MAIVTRYFSTTGAGAADGTTWADRAALFSAGNWSSVITGFAFNGADSLNCLIGTGSYTCSQSLASGLFTNPPSASEVNRLFLRNCDSSGNPVDPDPGWISAQRSISTTAMPFINYTGSGRCINVLGTVLYGLRIESANNASVVAAALSVEKCYVLTTGVGSSTMALFRVYSVKNSHVFCNTANYASVVDVDESVTTSVVNSRIEGIVGTTSNRRGINVDGFAPSLNLYASTILSVGGAGLRVAGQTVTDGIANNVINGCGSHGVEIARSNTHPTLGANVSNNMITNNGGWGVNQSSSVGMLASNNRLRNNTSGNFTGMGNYPTDIVNETAAGTDADEFVDSAGGDYRIKNTSSMWNKGYGVADQPAAGGSTRGYIIGG
jgi:hypothetical protein